jgi:predicted CXXCH cytochrome family protein
MKKSAFILVVAVVMVFGLVGNAWAYWESAGATYAPEGKTGWTVNTCNNCHGFTTGNANGPHGGFSDLTDSCRACHNVHNAASARKLLPNTTEIGICMTCHDFSMSTSGAGGGGVYGAIRAKGGLTLARHAIEGYGNTMTAGISVTTITPQTFGGVLETDWATTNTIPGGNGALMAQNASGNTNLSCKHCHTPHGNTFMAKFTGERIRSQITSISSNRLLLDNLMGSEAITPHQYTVYGSYWCAACHKNRHSTNASSVINHPVDYINGVSATNYAFNQAGMADAGAASWWAMIPAGAIIATQHQAGWSRPATNTVIGSANYWAPSCLQCHYNSRVVEQPYAIMSTIAVSGNPQFGTFPHETQVRRLLVETGDDLCLNCHPTGVLP